MKITLELLPEYEDAADYYDNDQEIIDNIESGKWLWFTAKVTASKCGVELASTYLGACCYEDAEDFIKNSGCYEDMVKEVTEAARLKILDLLK
jgi:hypothetical protein